MTPDPLLRKQPASSGAVEVFDSIIPRFGNSVFFTATDGRPNIRFNDMKKLIYIPAYWAITIWFTDKIANEEWTLEWMLNFLIDYNGVPQFVSQILGGHIAGLETKLDHNDLSGETWTAEVLIRRVSNKEVEEYKEGNVEFSDGKEPIEDLSVRYVEIEAGFAREYNTAMFDEGLSTIALNPEKPTYKEAFECRTNPRRKRFA